MSDLNTAIKLPAHLLCILCPNGCRLYVEQSAKASGDEDRTSTPDGFKVSGNQCKRGVDFAMAEIFDPRRGLTTTVRTSFPKVPVLAVRTSGEIPKGRIFEVMKFINTITVSRSLGIGEAVAENVLDLGVDIVVTSNILKEEA